MLTLKQITEQTDLVIAGLKKKHFKNAEEAIAQAISLNDARKKAQSQLDNNLAEGKTLAAKIGQAMKAGNKEEADQAKARVAELKAAGLTSGKELVKILGNGKLTAKIEVEAHAFSKTAEEAIKAVGGSTTLI